MTPSDIAEMLSETDLLPFVHAAAIEWCGGKECETSLDDVRYFENQWRYLSGLRELVVRAALRAMETPDDT